MVFGSGASYSQSAGRYLQGSALASKVSDQAALTRVGVDRALGRPGATSASPTRIQEPGGADSSAAGTVTLVARGPSAARSKKTNQIEALGSAPGRLWTVWRIQIPRPPPGSQALM